MTFAARLTFAAMYETQVIEALKRQGWDADPFGQAMLSGTMREHLRHHQTMARWLPDIIAAKDGVLVYVDAKASTSHRWGNHAVERASSDTMTAWENFTGTPVFYAFPHENGHGFVHIDTWNKAKRPGAYRGTGSGTPFDLAPCESICQIILANPMSLAQRAGE